MERSGNCPMVTSQGCTMAKPRVWLESMLLTTPPPFPGGYLVMRLLFGGRSQALHTLGVHRGARLL